MPHYFRAVNDYHRGDDQDDVYLVWPLTEPALAWEREQWAIFVDWDARRRAGDASAGPHPGHRGTSLRYDELDDLLAPYRVVPTDARRLKAEWRPHGRHKGYHADGPGYDVRWSPL